MSILNKIAHCIRGKTPLKLATICLFATVVVCAAKPCFGQQSDAVTYTYDSLNRLTQVTYSSGASIVYTYDAAGNRTALQVTGRAVLGFNSMTPRAGQVTGGQPIKLTGSFAGLSQVRMGGLNASWSYSKGTSEITVTTPPHAVGAVGVDLIPSSGVTVSKPNAFAYLPTTFTDNTLIAGVTAARAQHIIELRRAVDALRVVAGLAPAPWTDAVLTPRSTALKAAHIRELRSHLEAAAARLGYPAQTYTDPTLAAEFLIKRVHISELRNRIRAIAGW